MSNFKFGVFQAEDVVSGSQIRVCYDALFYFTSIKRLEVSLYWNCYSNYYVNWP